MVTPALHERVGEPRRAAPARRAASSARSFTPAASSAGTVTATAPPCARRHRHEVGQVELALRVRRADPRERLPQEGRVGAVEAGVHLARARARPRSRPSPRRCAPACRARRARSGRSRAASSSVMAASASGARGPGAPPTTRCERLGREERRVAGEDQRPARRSRASALCAESTACAVPSCSRLHGEAERRARQRRARAPPPPPRPGARRPTTTGLAPELEGALHRVVREGPPATSWRTLALSDFIRVPLPAARTMAASGVRVRLACPREARRGSRAGYQACGSAARDGRGRAAPRRAPGRARATGMPLLLALLLSATARLAAGRRRDGAPARQRGGAARAPRGRQRGRRRGRGGLRARGGRAAVSGLGGGGFALVRLAREGRVVALDFREVAPAGATPDMFAAEAGGEAGGPRPSLDGGLAVAVPGAVKGYAELARRFGTWPARRLGGARRPPGGARLRRGRPRTRRAAAHRRACLAARPAAARQFLARGEGGAVTAPAPGWRLVQPELARTLRAIGRDPEAFYRGALADRIAAAARADGGVLAAADLAAYRVRERAPLEGRYRGRRVVTMPLPSAGGAIVIALLQALEHEDPRAGGRYRPERFLHAMAELEKRLYARRGAPGRSGLLAGAAAAVAGAGLAGLRRAARGRGGRAGRRGARAAAAPRVEPDRRTCRSSTAPATRSPSRPPSTTPSARAWWCPAPASCSTTRWTTSTRRPAAPTSSARSGVGPNAPAPGKIPLSSMAPTLVFAPDGALWLAVGAPGGTTIPTTVAQVISHLVDDGMTLSQALGTPRLPPSVAARRAAGRAGRPRGRDRPRPRGPRSPAALPRGALGQPAGRAGDARGAARGGQRPRRRGRPGRALNGGAPRAEGRAARGIAPGPTARGPAPR